MSALSYTQDARRHRHRLRSSLPRVGASSVSARAEQFDPALSRLESRLLAQIATGMSEILNNPNIKSEMKDKLIQKQLQMLENGLAAVGGSSRLVPMRTIRSMCLLLRFRGSFMPIWRFLEQGVCLTVGGIL